MRTIPTAPFLPAPVLVFAMLAISPGNSVAQTTYSVSFVRFGGTTPPSASSATFLDVTPAPAVPVYQQRARAGNSGTAIAPDLGVRAYFSNYLPLGPGQETLGSTASLASTDVRFDSAGATVDVLVPVRLDGTFLSQGTISGPPLATNILTVSIGIENVNGTVTVLSRQIAHTEAGAGGVYNQTVQLGPFTVPTNRTVQFQMSVNANVLGFWSPGFPSNQTTGSNFYNSAKLGDGTAAFQLPPGVTASGPSLGIINNVVTPLPPPNTCYANCDGSTTSPRLNANDFNCFLNAFAAGQSYANCDNSTTAPTLNANDFNCFLNAFAAGCS